MLRNQLHIGSATNPPDRKSSENPDILEQDLVFSVKLQLK